MGFFFGPIAHSAIESEEESFGDYQKSQTSIVKSFKDFEGPTPNVTSESGVL